MGKSLVIKGADFSSAAVEQVEFVEPIVITPSWVEGYSVSNDGTPAASARHKYALVELTEGYSKIESRIGVSPYGVLKDLVFMEGNAVLSLYPTSSPSETEVGNPFVADIPSGATSVYINYIKDTRAAELGIPVMDTITFMKNI